MSFVDSYQRLQRVIKGDERRKKSGSVKSHHKDDDNGQVPSLKEMAKIFNKRASEKMAAENEKIMLALYDKAQSSESNKMRKNVGSTHFKVTEEQEEARPSKKRKRETEASGSDRQYKEKEEPQRHGKSHRSAARNHRKYYDDDHGEHARESYRGSPDPSESDQYCEIISVTYHKDKGESRRHGKGHRSRERNYRHRDYDYELSDNDDDKQYSPNRSGRYYEAYGSHRREREKEETKRHDKRQERNGHEDSRREEHTRPDNEDHAHEANGKKCENNDNQFVPDRSKSDYYCEICDAHMNNLKIWESHIAGKRHRKNMRKGPGELPGKIRTTVLEGAIPKIQDELDAIQLPVVGLSYMCEFQHPGEDTEYYTCFLCGGAMGRTLTLEHIVSPKHRLQFFKAVDPNTAGLLESVALKKGMKESLIETKSGEWEHDHGRGQMEVRVEKKRTPLPAIKNSVMKKRSENVRKTREKNNDYDDEEEEEHVTGRGRQSVRSRSRSEDSQRNPSLPPQSSEPADNFKMLMDTREAVMKVKKCPTAMKIMLLEELSKFDIENGKEANVILHVINILTQLLLHYKISGLPKEIQDSLVQAFANKYPEGVGEGIDLNEILYQLQSSGNYEEIHQVNFDGRLSSRGGSTIPPDETMTNPFFCDPLLRSRNSQLPENFNLPEYSTYQPQEHTILPEDSVYESSRSSEIVESQVQRVNALLSDPAYRKQILNNCNISYSLSSTLQMKPNSTLSRSTATSLQQRLNHDNENIALDGRQIQQPMTLFESPEYLPHALGRSVDSSVADISYLQQVSSSLLENLTPVQQKLDSPNANDTVDVVQSLTKSVPFRGSPYELQPTQNKSSGDRESHHSQFAVPSYFDETRERVNILDVLDNNVTQQKHTLQKSLAYLQQLPSTSSISAAPDNGLSQTDSSVPDKLVCLQDEEENSLDASNGLDMAQLQKEMEENGLDNVLQNFVKTNKNVVLKALKGLGVEFRVKRSPT